MFHVTVSEYCCMAFRGRSPRCGPFRQVLVRVYALSDCSHKSTPTLACHVPLPIRGHCSTPLGLPSSSPTPVSLSVSKDEVFIGSSSHCYFRPCSSCTRIPRPYSGRTTPQARRSGILFLHCAQHGCSHVYRFLIPAFTDLPSLCRFDDGPYHYMVLPLISSCLLCS